MDKLYLYEFIMFLFSKDVISEKEFDIIVEGLELKPANDNMPLLNYARGASRTIALSKGHLLNYAKRVAKGEKPY